MFDIHQSIYDQHHERDEAGVDKYINGLMDEFARSPEAQPVRAKHGDLGWAASMMGYAIDYIGCTPADMTTRDFDEVLFELIPRKVSVEPEAAEAIVDECRAFWTFVARQYGLENAKQILATIDDDTVDELQDELDNPANFGMAKSFFMLGSKAGFDMTSQEGLDEFTAVYNASLQGGSPLGSLPPMANSPHFLPPARLTGEALKKKRKEKKRQREAKKRNRRK
ncbi:hypothetical protein [Fimbriiglobus ruber]|uniref:Uncharacterized protein n=1 Tax=Fimbriiglobus ruber TaxID=1908690 RepID=A0A225CZ70_9BACT|nr:hypothetical protein [Fimbriiglobus ruber]OWK34552.1 hypothetical protein FRUB_10523 [Fimbriiglobus ruber]